MIQVTIVGGGLGGLLSAILLSRAGISTLVIEKKTYPFHKVCGEYISNEITPYLQSIGLFPTKYSPTRVRKLLISNTHTESSEIDLPLGGFGISRFQLDYYWYQMAVETGVQFELGTTVSSVRYANGSFKISTTDGATLVSKVVIGAFGKRSRLDKDLDRSFMKRRSGYFAVKYHLKYPWDPGLIALHGFNNGYCGVSMVENQTVNLCYLSDVNNLKAHDDIESMEKQVLYQNPHLAAILSTSIKLFSKPLVINEISFAPKSVVQQHILMVGDAAGLITPLCGNGMAMAIHGAKILAPLVLRFMEHDSYCRRQMEIDYQKEWRAHFASRLTTGRYLQRLLYNPWGSRLLINSTRIPWLAKLIIRQTHGPVVGSYEL